MTLPFPHDSSRWTVTMPHRIDVRRLVGEVIDKFMISSATCWDRISQKHTYPLSFCFSYAYPMVHFLHAQGTDRH